MAHTVDVERTLRKRYAKLSGVYWHHTIQLFPDLVAQGGKTVQALEIERKQLLDVIDFNGRSVIDIGSWTGYHAFEAKRAGAKRVIATDSYAWNTTWRGKETFDLARKCLELDVEDVTIDPTELPGNLEPVDIVMFFGVFYHMYDPIRVLQSVAALARDVLIVETHQDLIDLDRPAMAFYPRDTLQGDPSNWWGPNPECMAELLETVGFAHVYYQHPPGTKTRGYFHAFRNSEKAAAYLRRRPDNLEFCDLRSAAGRKVAYSRRI